MAGMPPCVLATHSWTWAGKVFDSGRTWAHLAAVHLAGRLHQHWHLPWPVAVVQQLPGRRRRQLQQRRRRRLCSSSGSRLRRCCRCLRQARRGRGSSDCSHSWAGDGCGTSAVRRVCRWASSRGGSNVSGSRGAVDGCGRCCGSAAGNWRRSGSHSWRHSSRGRRRVAVRRKRFICRLALSRSRHRAGVCACTLLR